MTVHLDKAALQGVSAGEVTRTVQIGLSGSSAGLLHNPASREDVPIEVRLSRPDRSGIEDLENLKLPGPSGAQVSLREVTNIRETVIDQSVYRKNLRPVVYFTLDVSGIVESPVYAIFQLT